jgi:hypothetical protein
LQPLIAALAAKLTVGMMALTVSPPVDGERLLTLQTGPCPRQRPDPLKFDSGMLSGGDVLSTDSPIATTAAWLALRRSLPGDTSPTAAATASTPPTMSR